MKLHLSRILPILAISLCLATFTGAIEFSPSDDDLVAKPEQITLEAHDLVGNVLFSRPLGAIETVTEGLGSVAAQVRLGMNACEVVAIFGDGSDRRVIERLKWNREGESV